MNKKLLAALAVGALVSGSRLLAATNDDFASRISLAGTNASVTGSNTNATKELGEPENPYNSGGSSVWWSWTAPGNSDATIVTDGSDFDTILAVYTGSSVAGLTLVGGSDNYQAKFASRVRFEAAAGTQYQIAVDGYNDGTNAATGNITLSLIAVNEPIARPPNDNFANRILLSGLPVTTGGSNVLATREADEPFHAGTAGDTSVWWRWTAPGANTVTINTDGSALDTVLAVYTGSSISSLTEVVSNDDVDPVNGLLTSAVTFDTTAGQTYQIALDGFEGNSGQLKLTIQLTQLRLSSPVQLTNGVFRFVLNGMPGRTNEIQASSNLATWSPIDTVVNTSGSRVIFDAAAANFARRFYRAQEKP